MTTKKDDFDLEKDIISLVLKQPFYAHVLLQFNRILNPDLKDHSGNPAVAGVNISNGKVNLFVNPKMWVKLSAKHRRGVLLHECLHIILVHLIRGEGLDAHRFNISSDMAVNSYIKELPDWVVRADQFGLPNEKDAEWYYKNLPVKKINVGFGMGDGSGKPKIIDNHDLWKEGTNNKEVVQEIAKQIVNRAMEQAKGHGYLPAGIERMIRNLRKYTPLNWQTLLRRFISRATIPDVRFTRKRPNRRYGYIYSGRVMDRSLFIVVAVDTSGSISGEMLAKFSTELRMIANSKHRVYVIECDADVQDEYEFRSNITKPKYKGGGGTDFRPAIKRATELKADCLVYLTDTYGSFPDKPPKYPVLWAVTPSARSVKLPFGDKVVLTDDGVDN